MQKEKCIRLSINKPTSVSTFIFFLTKIIKSPTKSYYQTNPWKLFKLKKIKIIIEIKTNMIDKILFLLSFSLKKYNPNKTLIIGIIK